MVRFLDMGLMFRSPKNKSKMFTCKGMYKKLNAICTNSSAVQRNKRKTHTQKRIYETVISYTMGLQEVGSGVLDWIELVQYRYRWRAMNLWVP